VQLVPVSERATPARRAPIPHRARAALLEHSHSRHEARSEEAEADPHHRRQGDRGEGGLLAAPHRALRPDGIYLTALANAEGKEPGGVFILDHETFDVRGKWRLIEGRSGSVTTCGGISATTPW